MDATKYIISLLCESTQSIINNYSTECNDPECCHIIQRKIYEGSVLKHCYCVAKATKCHFPSFCSQIIWVMTNNDLLIVRNYSFEWDMSGHTVPGHSSYKLFILNNFKAALIQIQTYQNLRTFFLSIDVLKNITSICIRNKNHLPNKLHIK